MPAGERSSIHDPRLDRAVSMAPMELFAFAERFIEAGVILRSDAADERSGREYQKKCGDQKEHTEKQMVAFEHHPNERSGTPDSGYFCQKRLFMFRSG